MKQVVFVIQPADLINVRHRRAIITEGRINACTPLQINKTAGGNKSVKVSTRLKLANKRT